MSKKKKKLIEIKNLFFKSVLANTGSSTINKVTDIRTYNKNMKHVIQWE